jgi:xanthine dehydrogenase YagS FAD-binding subunit
MGTVGGNLCQAVRCWYFRHPDLTCWLRGGETCYAQIGDHRKHGLEPGDCISVAPSDLAAALIALDASVETSRRPEGIPLIDLYRRPTEDNRSNLTLSAGEFVTAVTIPRTPDASAYERAGERHAWSFALAGVAAARSGSEVRLAAIGVSNTPRLLDPADPLAGLPGLEQTGWKRRLLAGLVDVALERVA